MQDNPLLDNTFYQFVALVGLLGGLLLIIIGMASSHPEQTFLGILLLLLGILWIAYLVYKYKGLGR
jgi:ABC-type Fe3+-siderophore transport system permease subunit